MSKCAIAPTDREWFASLQRNYTSGEVNFWTPTPWNVKGLLPRERLYFLHKAPVRKICGYGEFVRYENMSVSEAWDEFGRNNGVDSVDELVRKAGHYVEAHTPRTGTSDRSEIGCIVLDSVVLLDEEDYFDPADQDLDFAPQVVKIKYFDSDPGIPGHRGKINMIVISDEEEIEIVNELIKTSFTSAATVEEEKTLGYQGGSTEAVINYIPELDTWGVFQQSEGRWWNAFGLGPPQRESGSPDIIVEINFPFTGINRQIAGVIVKNSRDEFFLCHRGKIGGGRKGISKSAFGDFIRKHDLMKTVTVDDGGESKELWLISSINSDELNKNISDFVRVVQNFKNSVGDKPVERSNDSFIHPLLKWDIKIERQTIEIHKSIAVENGFVWWGKFGAGTIAEDKIETVHQQIKSGSDCFAFIYRSGELWRVRLLGLTDDPEVVKPGEIPEYYSKNDCSHFFKISDFVSLEPEWASNNLVLASNPEPGSVDGGLRNQASPIWVKIANQTNHQEPTDAVVERVTPSMEELSARTLWSEEALTELCESVQRDSQVILSGPPGTGKTWVAKAVADYMTGGFEGRVRLVQFHPSYGYEEFIEGLRPVSEQGAIAFRKKDGVVLQIADDIRDDPGLYVLIIDEMNRANLPRVFGELMYLFEYRDHAIDLQYTRDFSLPADLKFLATMNTADRSIRSIDAALRRRFEIFECPPDEDILRQYYDNDAHTNQVAGLLEGFAQLNVDLEAALDRHHTIGHTFFMHRKLTAKVLRNVWSRKLLPLIEEYFFDQPDLVSDYTLFKYWPDAGED